MHRLLISGFAFALLLIQPVQSQPQEDVTVGLGVSINTLDLALADGSGRTASLSPFTFTLPVTTSSFRLDPEIGFFRSSQSTDQRSQSQSVFTAGTGAFYLSQYDNAQLLIGGRLGLRRRGFTQEFGDDEESRSAIDFLIGPAVGGEYYMSPHFSIGVEARFIYVNRGTSEETPEDVSASQLRTSGVASLRVHF